jgi:hypothetical protein
MRYLQAVRRRLKGADETDDGIGDINELMKVVSQLIKALYVISPP